MTKKTETNNTSKLQDELDGFETVGPEDSDAPYFFKPEPGLLLVGELLGRFARRDASGSYYQIRLTRPCLVSVNKDEMAEAPAGAVVNVDERSKLGVMRDLLDNHRHEVAIKCIEKVQIKGGKSFWRMAIKHRVIGERQMRAPDQGLRGSREASSNGEHDEQFPF